MKGVLQEPERIQIEQKTPFDFGLYSEVFNMSRHRLPFAYETQSWYSILETSRGSLIPVEVVPHGRTISRLEVRVYSPTSTDELRSITEVIRSSFCTDVDLTSLWKKMRGTPIYQIMKRYPGLKPHLSQDPIQSLVILILRQLISAEQAKKVITNVTIRFGQQVRIGEKEFFSFPSDRTLMRAEKSSLLECGVGFKWKIVKRIAKMSWEGDLDFASMRSLSANDTMEGLQEIRGIGKWTSEVFLFDGLHKLEVYPTFDITVQRAIDMLSLSEGSVGRQISDLIESPWKAVYATYLFAYFREMRNAWARD